jgi:hypothetical protein
MRKSCSSGSVGERGGNDPLYPDGSGFFHSNGVAGREASHSGDGQGMNCHFKMFLDSGYTYAVLANYSQPSANIVANVIDQLISGSVVTK